MEKEPAARPRNAAEVIGRIAAIEGTLGADAPEHEADRETIRADDRRGAAGATRRDEVAPESGRSTVLTPERMAELSGPKHRGHASLGTRGPARQGRPSPPMPRAGPGLVSAAGSIGAAGGHGTGTHPTGPWRSSRAPPAPRPVWRGVVSTLITAAIVAGVGVYLWEREHQTLKITGVTVTAANQSVGCNGTADIIGTISTNGHGGTISYQWVENGVAEPPLVADDASGSNNGAGPAEMGVPR